MNIEVLKASCGQFSAKIKKIYHLVAAAKYRDDVLNERLNARTKQGIVVKEEIKSDPEDKNVDKQVTYMSTWGMCLYMLLFIYVQYLNLYL